MPGDRDLFVLTGKYLRIILSYGRYGQSVTLFCSALLFFAPGRIAVFLCDLEVAEYDPFSPPRIGAGGEFSVAHGENTLLRYNRKPLLAEEGDVRFLYVPVQRAYLLAYITAPKAAGACYRLFLARRQLSLFLSEPGQALPVLARACLHTATAARAV